MTVAINSPTVEESRVKDACIIELSGKNSKECPICGGGMRRLIDLPRYPLTEMYEPCEAEFKQGRGRVDQALLFCGPCSHGKLETIIQPAALYGSTYRTRTAASEGAKSAVWWFANFIFKQCEAALKETDVVIDIGGNDRSLLNYFRHLEQVAVDPIADKHGDIRALIEDADLSHLKGRRKLIVSSHTLEHIERPEAFFGKVASILQDGECLALQLPSLERLVRDRRIDQIHHQHIHYYSEHSLALVMAQHGLEIVASEFNDRHYGTMMVLAQKGKGEIPPKMVFSSSVVNAYELFRSNAQNLNQMLPDEFIAFGAALMLPVLAYHLPNLELGTEFIADNDKSKNGLRYINFNKRITSDFNLRECDVVISGIATKAAARSLVSEAFEQGARNVIVPLHAL